MFSLELSVDAENDPLVTPDYFSIGLATRYYFERGVTDGIRASGSSAFRICAGFLRSSVSVLDVEPYY